MPKTIDQIQERYTVLGEQIEIAKEEQHRLCEELMGIAEALPDQEKVDWSIVSEAVADAIADAEGHHPGAGDLQRHFKKHGLLVMHQDDASTSTPN